MPLISVVMTVYNNEKYFPKAVQSVLNQDFDDFELIIVDDGSTDKTSEIADDFAKKEEKIQVIHQENQWIYASFNNGIQKAKGKYIYILNSDDKLVEGSLALLASKVKEYHYPDVIWTKVIMHLCNENQEIQSYDYDCINGKVNCEIFYRNKKEVQENWLFVVESKLAENQANLYKRELMLQHPFRNDVYGADYLFNISIADDIQTALVLKEPIYEHYIYQRQDMNVSVGKYYGYEHEMFHEMYYGYVDLFNKWKISEQEYVNVIAKERMKKFIWELWVIKKYKDNFLTEQKLEYLFHKCVDAYMIKCSESINREEELESRILSAAREVLVNESLPNNSKMYFVYELLDSLLRYEKEEEDYIRIEKAISHPLNPCGIGKIFYDKIRK